jgi:hypothetical protein
MKAVRSVTSEGDRHVPPDPVADPVGLVDEAPDWAEPYGLIEQDYAPDNRRRKVIRLSAKGRAFISRVTGILDQNAA